MENIFLRFPQMGESIIRLLDNKSLVLCREVNKKWKNFIDCQKILSVRMIQRSIGNFSWRRNYSQMGNDDP